MEKNKKPLSKKGYGKIYPLLTKSKTNDIIIID